MALQKILWIFILKYAKKAQTQQTTADGFDPSLQVGPAQPALVVLVIQGGVENLGRPIREPVAGFVKRLGNGLE